MTDQGRRTILVLAVAGLAALDATALGVATNLMTGLPQISAWAAERIPIVLWSTVGAMTAAAVVLAVLAQQLSTPATSAVAPAPPALVAEAAIAQQVTSADAPYAKGMQVGTGNIQHNTHTTAVHIQPAVPPARWIPTGTARWAIVMGYQVNVSQPSYALVAQADAKGAFDNIFLGLGLGLGAVAPLGVGQHHDHLRAGTPLRIGLRRALGATKGHVRLQFFSEAVPLALLCGAAGVIPTEAWAAGPRFGAIAGLLPALRAVGMSPTEALWSV